MEFLVSRTSSWDEKPCDEAYEKEYVELDVRTASKPEDIPMYRASSDGWYNRGKNHKINDMGYIEREFSKIGWFVKINSLEELIEFKEKYGSLVMMNSDYNYKIVELEIYDNYRE